MSFNRTDSFEKRHIGTTGPDLAPMLKSLQVTSVDHLIEQTIPEQIRRKDRMDIPPALSEFDYLQELKKTASKNLVFRSLMGQGYFGTVTPSVISRNVFQNPGWYTQYTPYQAEIAQGRLEALLNYQTMVSDLTGMEIANASLLDEGTSAGEAMLMFYSARQKKTKEESPDTFFVDHLVYAQTIDVLHARAWPKGIKIVVGDILKDNIPDRCFGALIQYPCRDGQVIDYSGFIQKAKASDVLVAMATDLLALCLLKSPGELGADVAFGNSQRLGVPMGYGGPHAAFLQPMQSSKEIFLAGL